MKMRPKPLGDVMFDRSLGTLVFAFCLLLLHICLQLNGSVRPTLSMVLFIVGFVVLCACWVRAAAVVVRAWSDPTARVVRFASIGALLLTLWPAFMILMVTLMPFESD